MTFIESIRRTVGRGKSEPVPEAAVAEARPVTSAVATGPAIEISPSDPLFAYLQGAPGVVDVVRINLESTALGELRAAGVRVIVPLVTQGELIGALYLGPRLSDQEYSTDDRKLLSTLAAQAAPAIRVAQLVREQAVEIQARERLEQEMRVATLIQQQFLPRELPALEGWQVAAYYGPARAVGGDFYDFIPLPDGRLGIVVGDVTDKGVPAALDHGPYPVGPARRGAAPCGTVGGAPAGQRDPPAGDAGAHVRDVPLRCPRPGNRPIHVCQRRPPPAVSPDGRRGRGAARDGHAARPAGRQPLRVARGDPGSRPERRALQRRHHRGARAGR